MTYPDRAAIPGLDGCFSDIKPGLNSSMFLNVVASAERRQKNEFLKLKGDLTSCY